MISKILLTLILILCILLAYNNKYDKNYIFVLTLFTLIVVYQLFLSYENFNNPEEKNFLSIKGPSTIYNIQKNQDKDIELLEKQLNTFSKIYEEKLEKLDKKKNNYKKIKIDRSCPILNPSQSQNLEDIAKSTYFDQNNPLGDINMSADESVNLASKLNSY